MSELSPARPTLRQRLDEVLAHRVTKQFAQIVIFIGLSRLISIFGSAWAARCLGPAKLGISGMIAATLTQVNLLAQGNLDPLFIRRFKHCASEAERQQLIALTTTQRLCFSACGLLVALAIVPLLGLGPEWRLGIIAAIPIGLLTAAQPGWAIYAREDAPANYRITASTSLLTALLYFAFFRPGQATGSDLVVQAVAVVVGFVLMARAATGRVWPPPLSFRLFREFWPLLREGRWLFITGVAVYTYVSLELPLLGYLTTLEKTGRYRVAMNLVVGAQQLLAVVPSLLYPRFVEWKKRGVQHLWRKQLRLAAGAVGVLLPCSALAFLLGPLFFRLLYGEAFVAAAYPFAILMTSKFIVVVSGLFTMGLWAQAEDRKVFFILGPTALLSLTLNLLLIPKFDMWGAACVNLFSETVILCGCFWLTRRKLRQAETAAT